jgi:cytoskeletal protein RodZ
MRQNSRLVTSMAMAGLSALLALGMILTINRYQPGHTSSSQAITSAPAMPSASVETVTTPKRIAAATTPTPTVTSPKPSAGRASRELPSESRSITNAQSAVKTAAVRKSIRQKTHRNDDDDYVARDTYVRYGN